jgi:hypothetical protein
VPANHIDDILQRLHTLQAELEMEIDRLLIEKSQLFRYNLERGKVHFEAGVKAMQQYQRTGVWTYLRDARLGHILSSPVIYSMIIPFLLLDAAITIYQHVCFRVYRIPLVPRSTYLVIDRHQLAYLNAIEKINCVYCGYSNGLITYAREILARTEAYWCPIKHAKRTLDPHSRVAQYVDYGDVEAYKKQLEIIREEWEKQKADPAR